MCFLYFYIYLSNRFLRNVTEISGVEKYAMIKRITAFVMNISKFRTKVFHCILLHTLISDFQILVISELPFFTYFQFNLILNVISIK